MSICDRFNVIETPEGEIKIVRGKSRTKDTGAVLFSLDAIVWDNFVSWNIKEYNNSFLSGGKEELTERIEKFLRISNQ